MSPVIWGLIVITNAILQVCAGSFNNLYADLSLKCDDISEAINYLNDYLPVEITLTAKCKRYAIITSLVKSNGRLHSKSVHQVLSMQEDKLDQAYQDFRATDRLAALYMTAIDGLRAASIIDRPFFELIECLKRIDSPPAREYLSGEELNLILDLHKQIVESPDAKIDLDVIYDLKSCYREFVISLLNIFTDNIDYDSPVYRHLVRIGIAEPRIATSQSQKPVLSLAEQHKFRREKRLRLTKHRRREMGRLRSQRLEILNGPDANHVKTLFRHQKRKRETRYERRFQVDELVPSRHMDPDVLKFCPKNRSTESPITCGEHGRQDGPYGTQTLISVTPNSDLGSTEDTGSSEEKRTETQSLQPGAVPCPTTDTGKEEQHLPDLMQLWLDAAPVYDSIASPESYNGHPQIHDLPINELCSNSPSTSSSSSLGPLVRDTSDMNPSHGESFANNNAEQRLSELSPGGSEFAPVDESMQISACRLKRQPLSRSGGNPLSLMSPSQLPYLYGDRQLQLWQLQLVELRRIKSGPSSTTE